MQANLISRRSVAAWLGAGAFTITRANAATSDINDAINKGGRQRMLSQRVAKAYLAAGEGVSKARAHAVLESSIDLFEKQLEELKVLAPNGEVKATYMQLGEAWAEYKHLISQGAPSRENATAVLGMDGKVLSLANKGTVQFENISGKPLGKLVNIAGRQRMLSQRVAKYYLVLSWNLPIADARAELEKGSNEFVAALDTLSNAPQATPAIKQEIELARNQWVFYAASLAQRDAQQAAPERESNVFASSENILEVMEKVTSMYTQLGAT